MTGGNRSPRMKSPGIRYRWVRNSWSQTSCASRHFIHGWQPLSLRIPADAWTTGSSLVCSCFILIIIAFRFPHFPWRAGNYFSKKVVFSDNNQIPRIWGPNFVTDPLIKLDGDCLIIAVGLMLKGECDERGLKSKINGILYWIFLPSLFSSFSSAAVFLHGPCVS